MIYQGTSVQRSEDSLEQYGFRPADILVALSLLTRVPAPLDHGRAGRRVARAAWAFPVIGAGIGALGGAVYWAMLSLGVADFAAAGIALGSQALVTGALHEDGLADTVDGLGAVGRDPEQRRAIMRDSRLGAFGVLALLLAVIVRVGAVGEMHTGLGMAAMVAAGSISRASVVVVMATVPAAGGGGLSSQAGRCGADVAFVAALIGGVSALASLALLVGAADALAALGLASAASAGAIVWLTRRASRLVGGQTGDILGAVAVATEVVMLVVLGAMLAP